MVINKMLRCMHKAVKEKVFKTIDILNYVLIYLCTEGEDGSWHPCGGQRTTYKDNTFLGDQT